MPTVIVHNGGIRKSIRVPPGSTLLDVLRGRDFGVYAPCGGEGTCGKCVVAIREPGHADRSMVTSCLYAVDRDIEVDLPDAAETEVLATQYEKLREMPPEPGAASTHSPNAIGAAIDLGTTTIVVHLADLKSGSLIETRTARNPQAAFGADVISRIHHCMAAENGLDTLRSLVTGTINRLVSECADSHGLRATDIVRVTVAGNTTMLHILLGEDPEPLAFTPFQPVFTGGQLVPAAALGLGIHPRAEIHILPSFSAYVGADVVAGLAALDPAKTPKNYLFVDVGTNGELALVTPDRILCCATAAGPAFEGANLACGMEAAAGAICRYLGPDDYQTIANVPAEGICGSGLVDIVASLVRRGVIRKDGFLAEPAVIVPAAWSGVQPASGSTAQSESGVESESRLGSKSGRDILLTPGDVREVQLAKSAISAGVALLMRHAVCRTDDIGAVYLAGGLGNYLQPRSAVEIGLFPRDLEAKIIPVGNTAASGALLALKSERFGRCLDDVLSRMELFDLSGHPEFLDAFAENMAFPDT